MSNWESAMEKRSKWFDRNNVKLKVDLPEGDEVFLKKEQALARSMTCWSIEMLEKAREEVKTWEGTVERWKERKWEVEKRLVPVEVVTRKSKGKLSVEEIEELMGMLSEEELDEIIEGEG